MFLYNKKEHPRIYSKLSRTNRCSFSLCQFGFGEIKDSIVAYFHDIYVMGFDVFIPVIKDDQIMNRLIIPDFYEGHVLPSFSLSPFDIQDFVSEDIHVIH